MFANKFNFKKMGKKVRKGIQKQVVEQAKKEHLGKKLKQEARQVARAAVSNALASGMGAYGRGAYGRGNYGLTATTDGVNVNSLFNEYHHRRHKTQEVGDETGRVSVSRREYVMRVTAPASTEFQNTSFAINPGLSGVFAWLSQIAQNYDEYSLEHLIFHYKPVISKASQTGTMGSILLSCNYNAGAPKFASFREMAEYVGTLESRICDEAMFGIECDPSKHASQAVEYIRTGAVPSGEDIKTYDLGTFQLATSDIDAVSFPEGTLLGHLYVEYEVLLGKPKLYAALGKGAKTDFYQSTEIATPTNSFPLGSAPQAHPSNTLGATLSTSGQIVLPSNFYGRLMVKHYNDSGTVTMSIPVLTGNITFVGNMGYQGSAAWEISQDAPGRNGFMVTTIDVGAQQGAVLNSITIGSSAITSPVWANVTLMQINPDFGPW
jgi:hypothetical protein